MIILKFIAIAVGLVWFVKTIIDQAKAERDVDCIEAYNLGALACKNKTELNNNPYPKDFVLSMCWKHGYNSTNIQRINMMADGGVCWIKLKDSSKCQETR